MKSVLISIKPKYVALIANGQKTIEVRKTRPKLDTPFKCYLYCTKGENLWLTQKGVKSKTELAGYLMNGKVIGEFVCDNIYTIKNQYSGFVVANATQGETNEIARQSCLDYDDMVSYLRNKDGYAWHISDLVIYEQPKEVSEFFTPIGKRPSYMLERPFKSWGYVEEKE